MTDFLNPTQTYQFNKYDEKHRDDFINESLLLHDCHKLHTGIYPLNLVVEGGLNICNVYLKNYSKRQVHTDITIFCTGEVPTLSHVVDEEQVGELYFSKYLLNSCGSYRIIIDPDTTQVTFRYPIYVVNAFLNYLEFRNTCIDIENIGIILTFVEDFNLMGFKNYILSTIYKNKALDPVVVINTLAKNNHQDIADKILNDIIDDALRFTAFLLHPRLGELERIPEVPWQFRLQIIYQMLINKFKPLDHSSLLESVKDYIVDESVDNDIAKCDLDLVFYNIIITSGNKEAKNLFTWYVADGYFHPGERNVREAVNEGLED